MMGDLANKEQSGVVYRLSARLILYADPIFPGAVSANDFSLAGLRSSPITLFAGVPFCDQATAGGSCGSVSGNGWIFV